MSPDHLHTDCAVAAFAHHPLNVSRHLFRT
jgi:hypothetical protein